MTLPANIFLSMLDSLDAAVYAADMDTYEILYANKFLKDIFGEIVGKKCWQTFHHGQTGPCHFCSNKFLLDADGRVAGPHIQERFNAASGVWLEHHDRAFAWHDGRIVKLGVAVDVSSRKQLEDKLILARDEWEKTFNAVPDLVAVIDDQYRIVRVNRAMAARLRLRPEECVGRRCYEVVHGTDAPPAYCQQISAAGNGFSREVVMHEEKLGGDFILSSAGFADSVNGRNYLVHVAHEITGRLRAEKTIREANRELDLIFNTAADGLIVIDLDYTVKRVSNSFISRFGENRELVGRKCYDVFPGSMCNTPDCPVLRVESGETHIEEETEKELPDGKKNYAVLTAAPLYDNGDRLCGILASFKDLTARKQSEKALEEANVALKVLLQQTGTAKREIEENIMASIDALVMPYLDNLEAYLSSEAGRVYLQIVRNNLAQVTSSFSKKLEQDFKKLSLREVQVADLIRGGKNTKEIARLLNISPASVETYRASIRNKFGLINKKTNLKTFLAAKHTD